MKVLIIEAQIKQYRRPFYQQLFTGLGNANIELKVGYSDPSPQEAAKHDSCDLPAEYGIKVPGYWLVAERLLLQPLLRPALAADLVIVDQGNRFAFNHFLLPLSRIGVKRVAFWGVGDNRQTNRFRILEWYRRNTLNWACWWFAYTRGTARYLVANGVPSSKITVVDNAVDTTQIRALVQDLSQERRKVLRASLGIPLGAPVAIFCGTIGKVKRPLFLIESAKMIRARLGDFHLILVGSGPDESSIRELVRELPWIHIMGRVSENDKAQLAAISDVCLMPGWVGLVILDAFASGLPLLTTRTDSHGPEVEYLSEGINGLASEPSPQAFAKMAVSALSDKIVLSRLQAGARESGEIYTIENMAANFQAGIQSCLGLPTLQGNVMQSHVQP